ncbi:MAG: MFS transporter [Sphaerochaeta sp.]|nr:MFS transporter [Sphaerochaeta sp.]
MNIRRMVSGLVIEMILGSVYAWSVFVPRLQLEHDLTSAQSGIVFGTMIASFTLTTNLGSKIQRKKGGRTTLLLSSLLFMLGYVLASFSSGTFAYLVLGIGLIAGCGIGLGYIAILNLGLRQFARHQGLVLGIFMASFGAGSILLSYLSVFAMETLQWKVMLIFRAIGLIYGLLLAVCALFFDNHVEEQTKNPFNPAVFKQQLFSKEFRSLFLGMFAGTFAGLLIIGNLNGIAQGVGARGALSISLFSLGNILGRLAWGVFHYRLGNYQSIVASLGILALSLFAILMIQTPSSLIFLAFLCGFGFGACFVLYAASVRSIFGSGSFSHLYPVCFLGYGLSGLISPFLAGWLFDRSGSFRPAMALSLGILGISLLWIRKTLKNS